MILLDCEQGGVQWRQARLSVPTASAFDRILTATGKPSAQADKYLAQLAAEYFLGVPLDDFQTGYMDRGTQMEAEARDWYAFDRDADLTRVGLCLTDDRRAGASPDSLVGDDGLLEVKCPGAALHMLYVLKGVPNDYRVQVQGQLWVTGRQWCDLLSYNPSIPKVVLRIERDEAFIEALAQAVSQFCDRLDEAKAKLAGDRERHMETVAEAATSGTPF